MTKNLDELARALRDAPPDRDLSAIEPLVWRRLDDERSWAFFGSAISSAMSVRAFQSALSAIVLFSGVLAGAALQSSAVSEPDAFAVFPIASPLAPSTLLERS